MNALLQKVVGLFRSANEDQSAAQAGEALCILEDAIEYLQQFGIGRNLEYSAARVILNLAVNRVWADFGYQPTGEYVAR